ncbi:hypothetical protein BGZ96_011512 [Linnemannia gamsii]|uniref:Uncharacterized protein n=1 Tax=Linnemannia gamsii TaxID=64522 RepID=A0ABQ7JSJ0_9FUNG|nr:hypothetical protein BGZ96_011512 [Linnemannia gamsii]
MIFHTPYAVAVIGLFVSLLKLVFSLFAGATLVFYVKYFPDEYASSIRWSRTGGLREMVQLILCSYSHIPKRSTLVLIYAILIGICTLGVSTLLTAMVSRVDMDGDSTVSRAFTTHLNALDSNFWTAYMTLESTVEQSLTRMLNDTYRNPNPAPRTRYTPRSFVYETGCDESNTAIFNDRTSTTVYMHSSSRSCKTYIMLLGGVSYDWEPNNTVFRKIDSDTSMVVAPAWKIDTASKIDDATEPAFFVNGTNYLCDRFRVAISSSFFPDFPEDEMLTLPATRTTTCRYGGNGSLVMSGTYFQFAVNHMLDFDNITASLLPDSISLPLLKSMSAAIGEGVFASPTNNSTYVVFSKLHSSASDADFFTCLSISRKTKGGMGLMCSYLLTSAIVVNPQPIDSTIEADLGHDIYTQNTQSQLDFTIVHLPPGTDGNQEKTPLFSSVRLIKATTDATRYLASLGHNVQEYKHPVSKIDQLYVLYDSVELKDGYEVSTTAFIIICTFAGLFALIWAISEKRYPTVYNSSIYKTIYKELKSKDESVHMLMHCTHNPLAFNGNPVVLDPGDQSSAAPNTSSQDRTMISTQPCNNSSSQQYELQPLAMLEEIPALSPFLSSSVTAPTPIMSLATATTTTTLTTSATTSRPVKETQTEAYESDNLGNPPPIHPSSLRVEYNTTPTSLDQTRPHGITTHDENQTLTPSTI